MVATPNLSRNHDRHLSILFGVAFLIGISFVDGVSPVLLSDKTAVSRRHPDALNAEVYLETEVRPSTSIVRRGDPPSQRPGVLHVLIEPHGSVKTSQADVSYARSEQHLGASLAAVGEGLLPNPIHRDAKARTSSEGAPIEQGDTADNGGNATRSGYDGVAAGDTADNGGNVTRSGYDGVAAKEVHRILESHKPAVVYTLLAVTGVVYGILVCIFVCKNRRHPRSHTNWDEVPYFPTKWVDMLSLVPLAILHYFFIFTQRAQFRVHVPTDFSMRNVDYMETICGSAYWFSLFCLFSFNTLINLGVIVYHLTTPHHPKFYANKANIFSIVGHMIGGSLAIFGLYFTLWTGNKKLLIASMFGGLVLHIPSVFWQQQHVHGRREVIIPAYTFMGFSLFMSYVNIFAEDSSLETVMAAGFCLHVYAFCRLYGAGMVLANMEAACVHDRAIVWAGMTLLPFFLSLWGPLICVFFFIHWNMIFNIVQPFPRELLTINRAYGDVFPESFKSHSGETFHQILDRVSAKYEDRREAISHAAYEMLAGEKGYVALVDIEYLLWSWGMPQHKKVAKELFEDVVKEDAAHHMSFVEFCTGMHFIISNLDEKAGNNKAAVFKFPDVGCPDEQRRLQHSSRDTHRRQSAGLLAAVVQAPPVFEPDDASSTSSKSSLAHAESPVPNDDDSTS